MKTKADYKLVFNEIDNIEKFTISLLCWVDKLPKYIFNNIDWYHRKNTLYIKSNGYCVIHNFIKNYKRIYNYDIIKLQ